MAGIASAMWQVVVAVSAQALRPGCIDCGASLTLSLGGLFVLLPMVFGMSIQAASLAQAAFNSFVVGSSVALFGATSVAIIEVISAPATKNDVMLVAISMLILLALAGVFFSSAMALLGHLMGCGMARLTRHQEIACRTSSAALLLLGAVLLIAGATFPWLASVELSAQQQARNGFDLAPWGATYAVLGSFLVVAAGSVLISARTRLVMVLVAVSTASALLLLMAILLFPKILINGGEWNWSRGIVALAAGILLSLGTGVTALLREKVS